MRLLPASVGPGRRRKRRRRWRQQQLGSVEAHSSWSWSGWIPAHHCASDSSSHVWVAESWVFLPTSVSLCTGPFGEPAPQLPVCAQGSDLGLSPLVFVVHEQHVWFILLLCSYFTRFVVRDLASRVLLGLLRPVSVCREFTGIVAHLRVMLWKRRKLFVPLQRPASPEISFSRCRRRRQADSLGSLQMSSEWLLRAPDVVTGRREGGGDN